jgi:sugar (pentulose or hexulose) kinase
MSAKTILVPVDGASNIKLEALDFETLATVHSKTIETPVAKSDGLAYNATGKEFDWFDSIIQSLPEQCRAAAVVAPVARGASGGLVGADNTLMEVPGQRLTLSYTQGYPEAVNEQFAKLAGSREEFFQETGSIRDFPGSLTLLKRLVFEEMVRPQLLAKAAGFGQYGALMSGHFIGDDYLAAIKQAGNEHSYWMCHTGTRDVRNQPGTPSKASRQVKGFQRLVPPQPSVCYKPIGTMPAAQAKRLKLSTQPLVVPGGHDTCLSHLPILSTFYQAYPAAVGKPVLQVEAGTWTMIAQMGGAVKVPGDGYTRDIIIQGTVDGEPVVTARYGGGADFAHLKKLAQSKGCGFDNSGDTGRLVRVLKATDCFALPNINPSNHGTGPFPQVKGRIINEPAFFADGVTACLLSNLMTVMTTAHQVAAISSDVQVPIVLTAGGSKDPLFGALLATLTGHPVYAMFDKSGQAVTETTTLGAAIAGKAACLGVHPYKVDTASLGVKYRQFNALSGELAQALQAYRAKWMQQVSKG